MFGTVSDETFKAKFKNLRDGYMRRKKENNTTKSGQAAKQTRPYKWARQLEFLDKYAETTR